eukprot:7309-Heterococcus_DN1.PRE.1
MADVLDKVLEMQKLLKRKAPALCPNVIPDAFRGVSSDLGLLSLCTTEEQRKRGKAFLAEQTEADTDVSPRIS